MVCRMFAPNEMGLPRAPSGTVESRIECALEAAVAELGGGPPRLAAAVRHAVFPGGARARPRLVLAVAAACGDARPELADAAAAAVELLHCASLVHDDLPCFDDASFRRGQPSVHRAFGEALAVLAGDQLIVSAFECIAHAARGSPGLGLRLVGAMVRGVSAPSGAIAGQAWESEGAVSASTYRRAKTAALFEAAAAVGALAAGGDERDFLVLGARLGEAYQVADDIVDFAGDESLAGKPVRRDAALGRPNVARQTGEEAAAAICGRLMDEAIESVPRAARAAIREWISEMRPRLAPRASPRAPV